MLALVLLVGVYVMALAVVGTLAYLLVAGLRNGYSTAVISKGLLLLALLGIPIIRAMWVGLKTPPAAAGGVLLTRGQQPGLWGEVDEIAAVVGTRVPDEIRLVQDVNAAVSERARFLGLVGGRRVMFIGAPLLVGLTMQQLRSVLAHELGHYGHRHTALSTVTYRGLVTLHQIEQRLGPSTLTGRLFGAYGRLYARVSSRVNRRQELEADEFSHRVAGREAASSAMRSIPALGAAWGFFLEDYAFPVPGSRPEELFAGFGALLANPQRQTELDEVRASPPESEPGPYDSHPSITQRIAYFESLPEDGRPDDGTPALGMVAAPDELLTRLEDEVFEDSELTARSWEWIAETAGAARARADAALLVRASGEPGMGAATMAEAVTALGRRRSRQLVQPMTGPEASAEETTRAARHLVTSTIQAALVEHCGARFAPSWETTRSLVGPDGHPVDVRALVESVTDSASAADLLAVLADEGVPYTFAVDPAAVDAAHAAADALREPMIQSVAILTIRWRMRVLVVAENALILKRLGIRESLSAGALGSGGRDPFLSVLNFVAAIPLAQLLEDRRTEVFSWDDVGAATMKGTRLWLTLAGDRRRTRVKPHALAGDLTGSLAQHLGPRLTIG
ncbi:M48 family metallopeptidase [Nocardioides donggukensis]|uniref:M48 family metallopeptidase n=1 Tax=Nocardioides donggukensis TaxID=2774019 RepID=A0A927Q093_9ACTN|nr:M48 family metallopeptidase [Nocardioides donggukensis]MBD8870345.1 M48 family metallopeptidase [Nocardioides donggukensis]